VQSGVFVGNAWRHAFLIHIGIAAASSNRQHVYITRLSVEVSLIDASCTHMYFASNIFLYAAMPASSGAPVLFDTCTIAGVHTGALFHLDDEYIKQDHDEVSFVIVAACQ